MDTLKLSVVLATRNEEENITRCINSVKDIASEIIVFDEYSTDKTRELAEKSGAKVFLEPHHDIFHITKQKALEKAKGEWILQLDADEVVDIELAKFIDKIHEEIPELVRDDNASSHKAWWLKRKNLFLGRWLKKGGQYPDYTPRLYKKGFGRLPAKDVHEQAEVKGTTGHLKNDLLHVRDKSFSQYLERFNRYTDLIATQMNHASFVNNMFFKPVWWFLKVYFRHRGYVDGFPGFVFALY